MLALNFSNPSFQIKISLEGTLKSKCVSILAQLTTTYSSARMIVLILLLFRSSSCFLLTKSEPGLVLVSPGQQVSLTCGVDSHYEWCKWSNPGGRFCDFEWKRSEGNITMQECQLEDRVGILVLAIFFIKF